MAERIHTHLVFVTRQEDKSAMQARREVVNNFPKNQHQPIIITIGVKIPVIKSIHYPNRDEIFDKQTENSIKNTSKQTATGFLQLRKVSKDSPAFC